MRGDSKGGGGKGKEEQAFNIVRETRKTKDGGGS